MGDRTTLISGPRMRFLVNLFEALDAGMGVDLRRRYGRVPKQLLHGSQIGPGIEEVRRKRVAERVNRQPGFLIDFPEKAAHHFLDGSNADALAGSRDEDGLAIDAGTE